MSAVSGQLALEPDADGWLERVPTSGFDGGTECAGQPVQSGPLWAAYGVASALWQRSRTGKGCYIDISACEATSQSIALRSARHAYYEVKDGKHVFVAMIEPKFWARFCREVGRADLLAGREQNVDAFDPFDAERNAILQRELRALFRTRDREEWTSFFVANDLPCAPVNRLPELPDDPQLRAREVFADVPPPDGEGTFRVATEPLRVAGQERQPVRPAPAPGQDTEAVLTGLGYDAEQVKSLHAAGVVS
jgi:crotonobetainyl-CoA:carnitine CoA-transferase CaiB-like acyl-CoA transferase